MKRFLLPLLLLLHAPVLFGQTLSGTVFNRKTGEPIPGVYVYLNGTSTQTITDADGKFGLVATGYVNTELVISHMSYKTVTFSNPFSDLPQRIGMEEKTVNIDEVVVEAHNMPRSQMIAIFRRAFLGDTRAGLSCRIENEDDINLRFSPSQNTVWATCDVPLRIRNRYLGYDVLFELRHFSVALSLFVAASNIGGDVGHVRFNGTSVYTDKQPGKRRFINRRNKAYENSMNAFFRAVADGTLPQTNFFLTRELPADTTNSRDFTIHRPVMQEWLSLQHLPITIEQESHMRKMTINAEPGPVTLGGGQIPDVYLNFEVRNRKRESEGSILNFMSNEYYIDPYGNITNVNSVLVSGTMATKRLGDMLPLDFEMPQED